MYNKVKWTKEKFYEVRKHVRKLKIKSRAKYFEYLIEENVLTLPKRPDYWMIADEAKEYGMIDEVLRR